MTSPPVWSFGKSQRSGLVQSSTPGPGCFFSQIQIFLQAYAPFSYHSKKPQAWKIGTERKIFEYSNYKPGPGHYNSHLANINKREFPHYQFGSALKKQKTTNQFTPGAGAYNPNQKTKRQPDYSFGYKNSKTYESIGPGPAQYNGNGSELFNISRRPTSKIGTSQRSPLNSVHGTPGPDKYDISRPQTAGPQHKFGSSIRDQMLPDSYAFPGPGAYDHKSQLTNKATTMISRRPDKTFFAGNRAPGPGTYNPNKSQHLPLSKIGFSVRDDLYNSSTPGPGSYNPDMANRPRSATYKIGTSTRKPLQGAGKDTPGPGNYETKSRLTEAPKYFMAKKYPGQKIEGNPGPGHYEPMVTQTNNRFPQQIIGTSLRPGLTRDTQQIPGPGQYDVRKGIGGPFISIGNALRSDQNQSYEDPGPGAYDIPPKFADIPKYAMANSTYKSSYN